MQFHGKISFRIQLYYVLNVIQRFLTVFHSILRNKTSKKPETALYDLTAIELNL